MTTLLIVALALTQAGGGPTYKGQPREPNPFAPSLPQLTDKEQQALLEIVERFIEQDTGKLKGQAGEKAVAEFKALGPEAVFALLEGLNRAANMEDSCPAVHIGKKLGTIVQSTRDMQLLEFLRDNIGAGVSAKRHTVVLKDLRLACTLRQAALQRDQLARGVPPPAGGKVAEKAAKEKTLQTMTVAELATAVNKASTTGAMKDALTELATRKGDQVVTILGNAASNQDKDIQSLAAILLVEVLTRQSPDELKWWLQRGSVTVRAAAARVIGDRNLRLTDALIAALNDAEEVVRQAAREALVKLASSVVDHGPQMGAAPAERTRAQEQWRAFWHKKS